MNMRQERENRNNSRIKKKKQAEISGERYRISLPNYNTDEIKL